MEFYQGPLLAPGEVIGRGGTFVGFASGAAGMHFNPASVAARTIYNCHDFSEIDFSIDRYVLGLLGDKRLDIDNDGRANGPQDNTVFALVGFDLVHGRSGFGARASAQNYTVCTQEPCRGKNVARYNLTVAGLAAGQNFYDDQIIVGVELDVPVALVGRSSERKRFLMGVGGIVGAVWRPNDADYRLGASLRSPMRLWRLPGGPKDRPGFIYPRTVEVPWELAWGGAISFGPRPFNPAVPPGHEQTGADFGFDRRYLLLALDLFVTGRTHQTTTVESWLHQDFRPSGQNLTAGFRLGAESEVWADVLKLRAGTYLEPARAAGVDDRWHGTGGFELHLGKWWIDWSFNATVDLARDYDNILVTFGSWH